MTLRPPRALGPRRLDPAFAPDPLAASLNEEIMSEKRDTYVRLMKRLEKALAPLHLAHASAPEAHGCAGALRASPCSVGSDPAKPHNTPGSDATRAAPPRRPERASARNSRERNEPSNGHNASDVTPDLLDTAAEALLHVIIQRELLGLRNTEAFLRQMKVPRAVRFRMGVR